MVTEIDLKIRECSVCDGRCVSLGGPGDGCPHCAVGQIGDWTGNVKTVELPEQVAEQYREIYESEVVN